MSTCVATSLLVANAASIIATVAKYHVWSSMQGRYLFSSLIGGLSIFAAGVGHWGRTRYGSVAIESSMAVLVVLFGLYLSSEVGYLALFHIAHGIRSLVESIT